MNINTEFEAVSRIKYNLEVKLPKRSTTGSAGYDFYYNDIEDTIIKPKEIVYVKTGVKVKFDNDIALLLLNRSSNPKKKGLILANGVGLVDSDYYNNEDNEGEIAFAFYNITDNDVIIKNGDKLGQGLFVPYAKLNLEENPENTRTGGFGSTGK